MAKDPIELSLTDYMGVRKYGVTIVPGKSIKIETEVEYPAPAPFKGTLRKLITRTFKPGDTVIYDSYNLVYTGEIKAITEKGVSVVTDWRTPEGYSTRAKYAKDGTMHKAKCKRMKLMCFCWRNYNLDLEKVAAENADTMMYI